MVEEEAAEESLETERVEVGRMVASCARADSVAVAPRQSSEIVISELACRTGGGLNHTDVDGSAVPNER